MRTSTTEPTPLARRPSRVLARCTGVVAGIALLVSAACDSPKEPPPPVGRFTLSISGAADTSVSGDLVVWSDIAAGDETNDHRLVLWAASGTERGATVYMTLRRGTGAPAIAPGAVFELANRSTVSASLWLRCPAMQIGSDVCSDDLDTRWGTVILRLARADADSVGGTLEFDAAGWPTTGDAATDSVKVHLEFVAPRQRQRR